MYREQPSDDGGLAAIWTFQSSDISKATNGKASACTLPCTISYMSLICPKSTDGLHIVTYKLAERDRATSCLNVAACALHGSRLEAVGNAIVTHEAVGAGPCSCSLG